MTLSTTMAFLGQNKRWINWSLEPNSKDPLKPRKVPRSPLSGAFCSVTDSDAWESYDVAKASAIRSGFGVGYCFHEGDGLFFLDIDNCVDPATGTWTDLAQHLMATWAGHAAVEVSQSGKGLHVFGWASSIPMHACRNAVLGLELYHSERFVAFTDNQSFGAIDADVSGTLASVIEAYFQKSSTSRDVADWCDEGDGANKDDVQLLEIMLRSGKNTAAARFNPGQVDFEALWTADPDTLGKKWPPTNQNDSFDRSFADSALASHLVYWCGGNLERVERFMRQSALARDKWDDRPVYLENTILGAAGTVTNRAGPREVGAPLTVGENPQPAQAAPAAPGIQVEGGASPAPDAAAVVVRAIGGRTGASYLTFEEQQRYFEGCVYLISLNQIWHPAFSVLLDKARFDIAFGGRAFALTSEKGTKSAWEALTMSHGNAPTTARDTCFRPWMATGAITEDGLLNVYAPIQTRQTAGDATHWLRHMALLFPEGDDLKIITSYMARVVRTPGLKAQWWPVIQGCQGNGKTLINLLMMFCIGEQYSHQARASAMAKTGMQFNAWVMGKLYLGVEEIQVSDKRHFLEDFKDIVTNTTSAIEAKGQGQRMGDNYLNGMMFTNHRDAVPITLEDRRYAVFFTAQQSVADLHRDGMTSAYFQDLYDWLYGREAYAHLGESYGFRVANHWLRNVAEIDVRYDPAGAATRAPVTSATASAVVESQGSLEQEIAEAMASGEQGFAGGWASSAALDALLARHRVRLPLTKRHALMETLGYIRHPAMPDGRTARQVVGASGRTVLYLRRDHAAMALGDMEAITAAFERVQGVSGGGNAAAAALLK